MLDQDSGDDDDNNTIRLRYLYRGEHKRDGRVTTIACENGIIKTKAVLAALRRDRSVDLDRFGVALYDVKEEAWRTLTELDDEVAVEGEARAELYDTLPPRTRRKLDPKGLAKAAREEENARKEGMPVSRFRQIMAEKAEARAKELERKALENREKDQDEIKRLNNDLIRMKGDLEIKEAAAKHRDRAPLIIFDEKMVISSSKIAYFIKCLKRRFLIGHIPVPDLFKFTSKMALNSSKLS